MHDHFTNGKSRPTPPVNEQSILLHILHTVGSIHNRQGEISSDVKTLRRDVSKIDKRTTILESGKHRQQLRPLLPYIYGLALLGLAAAGKLTIPEMLALLGRH